MVKFTDSINVVSTSTLVSVSASVKFIDISVASNILNYSSFVNGRNCDLPYIQFTTLVDLPGAKIMAWLNPDSSTSTGWLSASNKGTYAITKRSSACVGGPYCGRNFTYEVKMILNGKQYTWSFYGYNGSSWSGCGTHTPKQLSFSQATAN